MEKSRPFKIVLITNLYPPHARGGAERVVELIAQELSNQKHEVVVITTAPKESQISNLKLKIYSIRPWNLFWYGDIDKQPLWKRVLWRLLDLYNISSARRVAKIFFKEHPDIVMTHNLVGMGYQIPQMLKRFRARHVHVIHDVQLVVPSGKLWFDQKIRWYYELYARVCRHLFGSPFVVVSPSQWLMDFYTSRGFFLHSEKIVLQNPISSTVIASGAKQSLVVATSPWADRDDERGGIHFLYVGQLETHKGILLLIEAVKRLQLAAGSWQLAIVGSGSLIEHTRSVAARDTRITVHGKFAHGGLADFYRNADAVIVPSLVAENQPTVILEAFSYGVPVIASRIGGIPELVEDGKTGFLVPPGDANALANALSRVAAEPKTLSDMRRAIEERGPLGLTPKEYVQELLRHCHSGP